MEVIRSHVKLVKWEKIDNLKGYKRRAIAFGNFSYILSRVESGWNRGAVRVESGWSRDGVGQRGGEANALKTVLRRTKGLQNNFEKKCIHSLGTECGTELTFDPQ